MDNKDIPYTLRNRKTNWMYFQWQILDKLVTSIPSKTTTDITNVIEQFNHCVQQAV